MLISILMPVKTAAPWLEETLNSILEQDYTDWELIAVDDFSADTSADILQEYAQRDSRIKAVQNKEYGIIPALQLALSLANGHYVTRMDADDIMPSGRLTHFVKALEKAGRGTVVTGMVKYFPEPVSEGYLKYEDWLNERVQNNDHYRHIFRECVVASPNWLMHHSDLLDHHIFKNLQYPEDYDMLFCWNQAGFVIQGVPETTLLWREHPQRTSRNSEVYTQSSFFSLKLRWFLELANPKEHSIALFGAGSKGKVVANFLETYRIPFKWYDMNHERHGAGIYDHEILPPEKASESLAIVCVYPDDLTQLEKFLQSKGYEPGNNAWYF